MTDFTPPRRLTAEDDADGFDCGLPIVNNWLHGQLRNAGKQHTAVAYATFCDGALAGFYTLGAYSIRVPGAGDRRGTGMRGRLRGTAYARRQHGRTV